MFLFCDAERVDLVIGWLEPFCQIDCMIPGSMLRKLIEFLSTEDISKLGEEVWALRAGDHSILKSLLLVIIDYINLITLFQDMRLVEVGA